MPHFLYKKGYDIWITVEKRDYARFRMLSLYTHNACASYNELQIPEDLRHMGLSSNGDAMPPAASSCDSDCEKEEERVNSK